MGDPWHVLGCGAMGSLFATQLARAGREVVLLPRRSPAWPGPIALTLEGLSRGRWQLPWEERATPSPIEQVLVFTKAHDIADAVAGIAHRLGPTSRIVLMANGMGFVEELAQRLPALAPLQGTTTQGAWRDDAGAVHHAGHGTTRIGRPGERAAPAWFAAFANAIPDCQWESDIASALWLKLAINCAINPLTAIHRCRNGELAKRSDLAAQVRQLCAEITAVSAAAGLGPAVAGLEARVFAVIATTAGNRSSMLQDISAGRRSEIDYINGYLAGVAHHHGVEAPLNHNLWLQVKQRERDAAPPQGSL
ncbi:MAG: ketopantoate reductase family protein [Parahaliea sp.]